MLVLLVPRFVHVGPIESAVDRVLEVSVGGIIALAVSLLVLPARAHSFVIQGAARTLDLMAGSLPELFEGFIRPGRREPASLEAVEAAFDHYAEAIASVGSEGLTQGLPVGALERIFTLGFALDQMRQDLRDLDRCASEIARRR